MTLSIRSRSSWTVRGNWTFMKDNAAILNPNFTDGDGTQGQMTNHASLQTDR